MKVGEMRIRILKNYISNGNRALKERSNWQLLKWKPQKNKVEQRIIKRWEKD